MERRTDGYLIFCLLQYLETARPVKLRCLLSRVIDRGRLPPQFHTGLEPVLHMCTRTDCDQNLAGLPAASPIDAKCVSLVTVVPLIERPHKANAGLDSHNAARPRDFIHA